MGKKILIIDDEPDVASFFRTILEDQGHTILAASDASEGMERLREGSPDLILLDLVMPGKTGVQFFGELKKDDRFKDIPIILVTGIGNEMGGDHRKFFEGLRSRVPAAYLEKPVDAATLLKTVNRVLAVQG